MDEEKKYRHRIQEKFSEECLRDIYRIIKNPDFNSNNQKFDAILFRIKDMGFIELASGTNRMAVLGNDGYVYKFALDSYGIRDNWTEFNMSQELQPYVTKTYECNGLIAVAEYVNLFGSEEFVDSRDNIRTILSILSDNYLFCDMGTRAKNFCNFGYREDGTIVVLDYGYIYKIDRKIMFCKNCSGKLKWNEDYSHLVCVNCGLKHDPIEIRDRMNLSEESFTRDKKIKGVLHVKLGR